MPTETWSLRLRRKEEEEGGGRKRKEGIRRKVVLIKTRDPRLAGGEKGTYMWGFPDKEGHKERKKCKLGRFFLGKCQAADAAFFRVSWIFMCRSNVMTLFCQGSPMRFLYIMGPCGQYCMWCPQRRETCGVIHEALHFGACLDEL